MTLIKSISGIRGTIGGQTGDTLNPLDIVKFTTAYAQFIGGKKIVVGRDGRISGLMVRNVVVGTLMGMGYDVLDIGYATTPTTELAVRMSGADGGIIITASHNPRQWNALKLLNREGEFLTAADGAEVLRMAEAEDFNYAEVDQLGTCTIDDTYNRRHIDAVLQLKLVDREAIHKRQFRVCADTINSVGGIILPEFFQALGVDYEILNIELPAGNHPDVLAPADRTAGVSAIRAALKAAVGAAADLDGIDLRHLGNQASGLFETGGLAVGAGPFGLGGGVHQDIIDIELENQAYFFSGLEELSHFGRFLFGLHGTSGGV